MKYLYLILFLNVFFQSKAQKTPLNAKDFDSWNSITEKEISPNGFWAIYTLSPQDGDSKLIFYPLKGNRLDTIARGSNVSINQNSQFAVFKIKPQKELTYKAKLSKTKKENLPKDSLGIYELSKNNLLKFPHVKSYLLPEKSENYLVFQNEIKIDTLKSKSKKESEENGSKLISHNLQTNQQTEFEFVTAYALDEKGDVMVYHSSGATKDTSPGVFVYSNTLKTSKQIFKGPGKINQLEISKDGQHIGFIINADTSKKSNQKKLQLYYWKNGSENAEMIYDSLRNNFELNDEKALEFSKDGSKLFYNTSIFQNPKPSDVLEEDEVKMDIWNWKDRKLTPQILLETKNGKRKNYRAVYNTNTRRSYQIANPEIPSIMLANEGIEDFVLGYSELPYSNEHWDWSGRKDLYVISTKNGESKKIAKDIAIGNDFGISPQGKYIYWYSLKDTTWFVYSLKNERLVKLPNSLFSEETNDRPELPSPYGIMGWSKNDDDLLLYDRYDALKFNPESDKPGVKLSNGRNNKIVFRHISLDSKERSIDLNKDLYFHQFNEVSKKSGYAILQNTSSEIKSLILDSKYFSEKISKAKESNEMIFTRESFEEFPDLYISNDSNFESIQKVSTANPQQKNKIWGKNELVAWNNLEGIPMEGILYKPENFDSTKSYPMITYFYEKLSDEIHRYKNPQPERASVNFSFYTSNGYFVFVPDIIYKEGYPGMSAYNCIVPGVLKMLERPYINPKKLALQGHSWGGYQTGYLITKTNMFAAAEAGALVANMTSAYGGIRWETGVSRMSQYEKNQSRIGATLWEKPMNYIENSPLFYLPNVNTPLLMMHNDADGAVPWYQGIEMFLGLKRLNKPVWMLNYNGEKHGLTERKNKKDWSARMFEFFEFYLNNKPEPDWMKNGN